MAAWWVSGFGSSAQSEATCGSALSPQAREALPSHTSSEGPGLSTSGDHTASSQQGGTSEGLCLLPFLALSCPQGPGRLALRKHFLCLIKTGHCGQRAELCVSGLQAILGARCTALQAPGHGASAHKHWASTVRQGAPTPVPAGQHNQALLHPWEPSWGPPGLERHG